MSGLTVQTAALSLPKKCPVIALRDLVLFRDQYLPIRVGRPRSVSALLTALEHDKRLVVFTQVDDTADVPNFTDLLPVGTFAEIVQHLTEPNGDYKVLLHGLERVTVGKVISTDPYLCIAADPFVSDESPQEGLAVPSLTDLREAIGALAPFQPFMARAFKSRRQRKLPERLSLESLRLTDPAGTEPILLYEPTHEPKVTGAAQPVYEKAMWFFVGTPGADIDIDPTWDNDKLADVVMISLETARKNKIESLLERNTTKRLAHAYGVVIAERRHAEWDAELKERVTVAIKDQHRELFLREQLRVILEELGESVAITLHNPVFRGRGFASDPNLAFVLMPFADRFRPVFDELVKPVVERFQLRPVRADDLYGPRPIMEDIWRLVNEARIIIADVTDKNPNVFYEVGLAHAVGKEVVIISQSLDDVPFDLRHLRCIVYQDSVAGFKQFERRLDDTLAAIPGLSRTTPAS